MASLRNEVSIPARRFRSLLISVALIAGIGVSGTALTPNGPHPDQPPQREILLNGLRVVAVNRPGDRVAVVCVVRAGAMFDPAGKSGLANLTAGLLLEGAGSYTGERIRGELEDASATLEIRTDWDATWIEAEAPAAQLTTLLDVMSLMVSSPKFAQALYGKHTYGRSIWGDRASLESIKAGDVKVFFDKFYASNTGVVVVAGPVDGDAVMGLARARFGRWTKKKVVPATFLPPTQSSETRVVVVNNHTAGRAVVRAGFFSVGRESGDAALLKVMAERLGVDLARRIGESDVAATFELRTLQSPFVVSYAVPVSELGASIDAVSAAMEAMQQAGPDGGSKVYFPKPAGTALAAAHVLAATDYFAGQKLQPDPVDVAIDAARLAPAARTALKPGALVVVVVGDASEIATALKDRYKIEVAPST
jgi:predicted Zn-dependent peptidase